MSRIVFIGRVDKFLRRKCSTTFLALVTIGTFCTTTRTSTHDVAVCEEFSSYLIAELLLYLLFEHTLIIESAEEIRSKLIVNF